PTKARHRQNAAMTGAAPPPAPEPSSLPSAPRSCARPAAAGRCNSRAAVRSGPRARARSQALPHTPQIALRSLRSRDSSQPSALSLNLAKYLILDPYAPRLSDSVRLADELGTSILVTTGSVAPAAAAAARNA